MCGENGKQLTSAFQCEQNKAIVDGGRATEADRTFIGGEGCLGRSGFHGRRQKQRKEESEINGARQRDMLLVSA